MLVLSNEVHYSGQWGTGLGTMVSRCPMLSHPLAAQIQRNQFATSLISTVLYCVLMQITHSSGAFYLGNYFLYVLSTHRGTALLHSCYH